MLSSAQILNQMGTVEGVLIWLSDLRLVAGYYSKLHRHALGVSDMRLAVAGGARKPTAAYEARILRIKNCQLHLEHNGGRSGKFFLKTHRIDGVEYAWLIRQQCLLQAIVHELRHRTERKLMLSSID
jgi:hypothetical protein